MTGAEGHPVPRRERARARIHESILEAARAGIGRGGINGITMNEIAEEADVSRATLFKYFGSKNEIVSAVAEEMQKSFFRMIDRCIAQTDDPGERVRLVFTKTAAELENSIEVSKQFVAISFLAVNSPTVPPTVERFGAAFRQILSTKELAHSPHLDLITDFTAGIFVGILHRWLTVDPYPLWQRMNEAADEIAEMIARRTRGAWRQDSEPAPTPARRR